MRLRHYHRRFTAAYLSQEHRLTNAENFKLKADELNTPWVMPTPTARRCGFPESVSLEVPVNAAPFLALLLLACVDAQHVMHGDCLRSKAPRF